MSFFTALRMTDSRNGLVKCVTLYDLGECCHSEQSEEYLISLTIIVEVIAPLLLLKAIRGRFDL